MNQLELYALQGAVAGAGEGAAAAGLRAQAAPATELLALEALRALVCAQLAGVRAGEAGLGGAPREGRLAMADVYRRGAWGIAMGCDGSHACSLGGGGRNDPRFGAPHAGQRDILRSALASMDASKAAIVSASVPPPLALPRDGGGAEPDPLLAAEGVQSALAVAVDDAGRVLVTTEAVAAGAPLARIPARWLIHTGAAAALSPELDGMLRDFTVRTGARDLRA